MGLRPLRRRILAGSLCSLFLFLPNEYTGGRGTDFNLVEWYDPTRELARKISELGPENQKAGKGPNNFRCDLIEATLSSLPLVPLEK